MDNKDEKYFHVWCDTNFYLNFIKGNENLDTNNEEIKNVLIKSFSTITETNK
jgi:hypothetical protein